MTGETVVRYEILDVNQNINHIYCQRNIQLALRILQNINIFSLRNTLLNIMLATQESMGTICE